MARKTKSWQDNIFLYIIAGVLIIVSASGITFLIKKLYFSEESELSDSVLTISPIPSASEINSELEPISLMTKSQINPDNVQRILDELRLLNGLRPLTNLESNLSISELPTGTYFYLAWVYLDHKPYSNEKTYLDKIQQSSVEYKPQRKYADYEIHYINEDKILLVSFTSAEMASINSKLDGKSERNISVSPYPFDAFNTLINIPIKRIEQARSRAIESSDSIDIEILDITVK